MSVASPPYQGIPRQRDHHQKRGDIHERSLVGDHALVNLDTPLRQQLIDIPL